MSHRMDAFFFFFSMSLVKVTRHQGKMAAGYNYMLPSHCFILKLTKYSTILEIWRSLSICGAITNDLKDYGRKFEFLGEGKCILVMGVMLELCL